MSVLVENCARYGTVLAGLQAASSIDSTIWIACLFAHGSLKDCWVASSLLRCSFAEGWHRRLYCWTIKHFVSKQGCAGWKGRVIGVVSRFEKKTTFAESASFTLNHLKAGVSPRE